MEEWIKKSDVLEMLSLPPDIFAEHIYELKGVWVDENWNDWIPCSERLPDKAGDYLVTIPKYNGGYDVMFANYDYAYSDEDKMCFHEWDSEMWRCYRFNAIAWMPLPEPYNAQ